MTRLALGLAARISASAVTSFGLSTAMRITSAPAASRSSHWRGGGVAGGGGGAHRVGGEGIFPADLDVADADLASRACAHSRVLNARQGERFPGPARHLESARSR